MKLVTDKPQGLPWNDFILMGIISDSNKDYGCLLQLSTKQIFIEEIHWGPGRNIYTATLHQIDNDKEWASLISFVTKSTTIFSPKKMNEILQQPSGYFYSSAYKKSKDYEDRKKKEIL